MRLAWGETGAWQPQGGRDVLARNLRPGQLIEVERALWQVTGIRDVPVREWDDDDRDHYERHAAGRPMTPEAWPLRPVYVIIRPADGSPARKLRCRPYSHQQASAYVIPAHHPVCAACGELYPCRHLQIDEAADAGLARLADLEAVLPGCCWHCREPVGRMQKSISFDGDNLLLPGAPPPLFHLRQGDPYCRSAALIYEKKWVTADSTRQPRLHCPGRLTQHVDGHECTAGDRCPGPEANHLSQCSHKSSTAWLRDCERCRDACERRGMTVPAPRSRS